MKATIDVPDALYREVKAKSALEGRPIREVVIEFFQHYVGWEPFQEEKAHPMDPGLGPTPPWFGSLGKYRRQAEKHDMESIRQSIAAGLAKDRRL